MLFLEGTVVKTRLMNLQELRQMRPKSYKINVYRSKRWSKYPIEDLVPGDICSVTRAEKERLIPADMLLLSGTSNATVCYALIATRARKQERRSAWG